MAAPEAPPAVEPPKTGSPFRRSLSRGLFVSLLNGGIAGCVGKTATAPLARLTVLAQTASLLKPGSKPFYDNVWSGIKSIIREEGCTAVGVCYPIEIVRTRLMAQSLRASAGIHGGARGVVAQLRRDGGLYRGVWLSMLTTAPAISMTFGTYGWVKDFIEARGASSASFTGTLIAGGLSGITGSVVVFPLDVLKRRVQVMGMYESIPVRSWTSEAGHIFRNEGVLGFWRGIVPEVVKVFPTVALAFLTYEQLQRLVANSRGQ